MSGPNIKPPEDESPEEVILDNRSGINLVRKMPNLADEFLGFDRSERFINRELSWLAFNLRVVEEAENKNHPLLERLNFLSISAKNLDEFFMVRVAGLAGQKLAGVQKLSQEGATPEEQLDKILMACRELVTVQERNWREIIKELDEKKVLFDIGLNPEKQFSILSSIRNAQQNANGARDLISSEFRTSTVTTC